MKVKSWLEEIRGMIRTVKKAKKDFLNKWYNSNTIQIGTQVLSAWRRSRQRRKNLCRNCEYVTLFSKHVNKALQGWPCLTLFKRLIPRTPTLENWKEGVYIGNPLKFRYSLFQLRMSTHFVDRILKSIIKWIKRFYSYIYL